MAEREQCADSLIRRKATMLRRKMNRVSREVFEDVSAAMQERQMDSIVPHAGRVVKRADKRKEEKEVDGTGT